MDLRERKRSHLSICATQDVGFRQKTTLFEDIDIIHRALPELRLEDVDLSVDFAGRRLAAPILIGAMTGGTGDGPDFNADLAAAARRLGVGLCLGSMRPLLEDDGLFDEFNVRDAAPDILLFANIGGNQLAAYGSDRLLETARRIGADGLIVHLNAGMELIQPRGHRDFRDIARHIGQLVAAAGDFPIMVKETGMGLSPADGGLLRQAGVRYVETGGAGGTSWVGVETLRAQGAAAAVGQELWDFGIPTAVSTAWMVEAGFFTVSSGGIGGPLDAATALALGARAVAVARPVLKAHASDGRAGVEAFLSTMIDGLRAVMVCCGAATIDELRRCPLVLGPRVTRYIEAGRSR